MEEKTTRRNSFEIFRVLTFTSLTIVCALVSLEVVGIDSPDSRLSIEKKGNKPFYTNTPSPSNLLHYPQVNLMSPKEIKSE